METIGSKVATLRKNKGLTQEEAAAAANISLRTLQRIEKDVVRPRGHSLHAICTALGTSVEGLMQGQPTGGTDRLLLLHLSVMLSALIPLANFALPLVLWLSWREKSAAIRAHGSNTVTFQVAAAVLQWGAFSLAAYAKLMHYGTWPVRTSLSVFCLLWAFNIIYPLYVAFRISRGYQGLYYPQWPKR
ncbi:hypothetical protein CHU92_08710 [Flavobacterium cyanobacteriorum]|uniref:HTH cro/C1-type domain-containing protein n=1 Tax=Flavobacterium cyanobacteriorum TaxID=2022802 RepID=A0A255Z6Z4_9FLAO|nr:helix-turn-helix domain-containing protein [Flavobacterium cyanobacteriorum]OYQ37209.1 hypothetical protein CHU92_08710 [Flavobacterium cyanobacteriorum]